jgi:uncharacterized protein
MIRVTVELVPAGGGTVRVVDPVGSWWGLRSSSDGKSAGLEIPIFGGRHADVPLERTGGQLIADLVVDDRPSCVLDISEFSEGDKIRFLIDFAERLYRRNTEPLHLFLEEADDYAPQRPFREQARLLRAWENVVRRGRARGLGITLITQRSAALNKNVLTQIETLFVLRTTSPQDRKAIAAWIEYHGEERIVLDSLPRLKDGEAWVWSPQWLKTMERIQVRRRSTFDSAATPKQLRAARPAATLADVDLAKVRERMAASIERAKQEDPRELRARVAQLERELVSKPAAAVKTVEVPALKGAELKQLERLTARVEAIADRFLGVVTEMGDAAGKIARTVGVLKAGAAPAPAPRQAVSRPAPEPRKVAARAGAAITVMGANLPRAERRILIALAQYPAGRTKRQLAVLTGYAINGGGFNNSLGALRSTGRAAGSDPIRITDDGLAALGNGWDPLPEGPALLSHWRSQLPKAERAIFEVLADAWPRAVGKEELAGAAGYEASGGGFNNALGRLRTLELIEGRGEVKLSDELGACVVSG